MPGKTLAVYQKEKKKERQSKSKLKKCIQIIKRPNEKFMGRKEKDIEILRNKKRGCISVNYYALFILYCTPCAKIVFPVEVALSQKEAAHYSFYWSNRVINTMKKNIVQGIRKAEK